MWVREWLTGLNIFCGETRMLEAIPIPRSNVIPLMLPIPEFYGDGAPAAVGIWLGVVAQRVEMS